MAEVTFLGTKLHTVKDILKPGDTAPDFVLTRGDLSDVNLNSYQGFIKIFNIFPSIDTPVCASSVKEFNERASEHENIIVLNISQDLPFASSRFCAAEGLKRVETLSTFRSSFPEDYGVKLTDGPLRGLCSRSVIIVNRDNRVIYSELVSEISHHPDYEAALEAIINAL